MIKMIILVKNYLNKLIPPTSGPNCQPLQPRQIYQPCQPLQTRQPCQPSHLRHSFHLCQDPDSISRFLLNKTISDGGITVDF